MLFLIQIFFFLFFSVQIFAEEINDLSYSAPDQIVALTQEFGKIGRIISPLSGQPCLRETDLVAKGAQDVVLKRIFVSQYRDWHANQILLMSKGLLSHQPDVESGWIIFPHTHLDQMAITKRKHHKTEVVKNEVRIVEQNGVALTFSLGVNSEVQLVDKPYGICNCNSLEEMPSGQYDPRNTKVVKNKGSIEVHSPSGSIYHYRTYSTSIFDDHDSRTKVDKSHYLLAKEILPNGKVLHYIHDKEKKLVRIESRDPQSRHVYASLDIDSSPEQSISKFLTNTGMKASYHQNVSKRIKNPQAEGTKALNLLSINSTDTPHYSHETISLNGSVLNYYSGKRNLFTCQYVDCSEYYSKNKRVSKLLLPTDNKELKAVHEFCYDPPLIGEKEGSTSVKNIDGTSTTYEYSDQLLLKSVKYFDVRSSLKKKKEFYWTDNHWLSGFSVQDEKGNVLYKKTYEYDPYGNPILEVFCGDIRGNGVFEKSSIVRKFSDDGRHLLLEEKNDEGKILCFEYLTSTNLLTAKFTKYNDLILKREFYKYDDCYNLIQKIEDNGTSKDSANFLRITQRKITNYTLRNEAPFFHMPEWIEEKYLENDVEKLLKRTHLAYDIHGNISEESIYDADGLLAYTLHKSYDDRGHLISESNAIGQEALYSYDDKGRCIFSTNFSQILQKKMEYDQRDRLTKIEEVGIDGIIHSNSYFYDSNDRLMRKTDHLQNITHYFYDPISHKIIETHFPPIEDQNNQAIPVTTYSSYDVFGRELSKTDANGNTTRFKYAGHILPIETIHPDGSKESFCYRKSGLLESHVDQEGLKTSYSYDLFGRLISKSFANCDDEIAKESFVYDSFHLIEKSDREGNKTFYKYDGAGRLIAEEFCGKITQYFYDSLGYLSKTSQGNIQETLFTHYKRDLLGRVLEETCTDVNDHILTKIAYTYDADGNLSTITRNIDGKDAIESFAYDSFQCQIKATDALGYQTKIIYNKNALNAIGQHVLQITTINPKNQSVVRTEDAYGKVVQEDVTGLDNQLITTKKMSYDPNGNLLLQKNLIFQNGQYQRTLETQYQYNSKNHLISSTRAANSSNSRKTSYSYTPTGKIATKIKPDGTILSYRYHPLGYLKTINSNDQFKLSYDYNLLGNLVQASDEIKNVSIQRTLDPHGNILSERLSTGLTIHKKYDTFDRPLSIVLPDQGQILYTYDPLFLRIVSRISPTGDVVYSHQYTGYDLTGYLKKENLIGNLETVEYVVDAKGRKSSIEAPSFKESYCYDETDNLIEIKTNKSNINCSYDELDQLTVEGENTYVYDTNFNRIEENGIKWTVNELDELLSTHEAQCIYDLNGNLLSKKTPSETINYSYDPLDRLIEVIVDTKRIEMSYDPLGRRLSKIVHENRNSSKTIENYLYDGETDVGTFTIEKKPLQLRVLGLASHQNISSTIAIELGGQIFAPIQDFQGNIRQLICPFTKKKNAEYQYSAFGHLDSIRENTFNPWRYASKRLDLETNLVHFGKRFYDAELSRWITTDPASFIDGMNLYGYVKNNPYRYIDPNGLFAFPLLFLPAVFEISFAGVVSWISAEAVIGAAAGAALGIGVYQLDKALNDDPQDISLNNEAVLEEVETKTKKKKNSPPPPDPKAEGNPHTIVEKPGQTGQYTTHNGDDTYKQYRGEGKPHGPIERPNIKETKNNTSPNGTFPGKPEYRSPRPDEIPNTK